MMWGNATSCNEERPFICMRPPTACQEGFEVYRGVCTKRASSLLRRYTEQVKCAETILANDPAQGRQARFGRLSRLASEALMDYVLTPEALDEAPEGDLIMTEMAATAFALDGYSTAGTGLMPLAQVEPLQAFLDVNVPAFGQCARGPCLCGRARALKGGDCVYLPESWAWEHRLDLYRSYALCGVMNKDGPGKVTMVPTRAVV